MAGELAEVNGEEEEALVAYVDDALDAGLLHGLATRRLVHVLVVLPPSLRQEQSKL